MTCYLYQIWSSTPDFFLINQYGRVLSFHIGKKIGFGLVGRFDESCDAMLIILFL